MKVSTLFAVILTGVTFGHTSLDTALATTTVYDQVPGKIHFADSEEMYSDSSMGSELIPQGEDSHAANVGDPQKLQKEIDFLVREYQRELAEITSYTDIDN